MVEVATIRTVGQPMTGLPSDRKPTAAAVEALVRSIEAKEAQGPSTRPAADVEAPAIRKDEPEPPVDAPEPPVDAPGEQAATDDALAGSDTAAAAPRTPGVGKEPPAPPLWTQIQPDPGTELPPVSAELPVGPSRPPATGWAWSPTARGPLPGLIDPLLWESLIAEEAVRQRRYGRPTAVVLAELDGLEAMVERMGQAAMNRLVPPCAEILVSMVRDSDRVARLTDARFGLLLLETDIDGAARFAARIAVAAERWLSGSQWPVRLIVGWAAPTSSDELRRAVRDAEAHLDSRRD